MGGVGAFISMADMRIMGMGRMMPPP